MKIVFCSLQTAFSRLLFSLIFATFILAIPSKSATSLFVGYADSANPNTLGGVFLIIFVAFIHLLFAYSPMFLAVIFLPLIMKNLGLLGVLLGLLLIAFASYISAGFFVQFLPGTWVGQHHWLLFVALLLTFRFSTK